MKASSKGEIGAGMQALRAGVAQLAERGVYLGTSSWKYAGWRGQLYSNTDYNWRGKFSQARFEKNCLNEYAAVFSSVCVDAAYYTFPRHSFLEGLIAQVPTHFQFALKVTDSITIKHFPKIARFGPMAGKVNPHFLDAELFESQFLGPCLPFRNNIGMLILEFSRFSESDFQRGRDFLTQLDGFLGKLPKGWPYGVEIRNKAWLQAEYFACLERHNVSPVFNSWEAMPSLGDQLGACSNWQGLPRTCARLLLKPGRRYEDAVKSFSPYEEVREEYPEGRTAAATLAQSALDSSGRQKLYMFVNNRFEGNALGTILGILDLLNFS